MTINAIGTMATQIRTIRSVLNSFSFSLIASRTIRQVLAKVQSPFILLIFASTVFAQGVRYDIPPILKSTGVPVGNPLITLCTGTSTISGSTCSVQAQAFTDITLTSACSLGLPVTLAGTNVCQSTGDSLGNAGFWLSPGAYIYCVNGLGITGKCYNLTVPVGSTGAGVVVLPGTSPWADITSYGAKCDGSTDDTTAINNALAAANTAGGGWVFVPSGKTCVVATALNCDGCSNVKLVGFSGAQWPVALAGAQRPLLKFTNSTAPLVSLRSTFGVVLEGLNLQSTNAGLTDRFVTFEHNGANGDSQGDKIKDVIITGTATAANATCLLCLDKVDNFEVDHAAFHFAVNAIRGQAAGASYSNTVYIHNSSFGQASPGGTISGSFILSPGFNWNIGMNNDFELGTALGNMNVVDCSISCGSAFDFIGNFVGDATAGWTGTVFKNLGLGGTAGSVIQGNSIVGGTGLNANFLSVASGAAGITIQGNLIQNFTSGLNFIGSNQSQVIFSGNFIGSITTLITSKPSAQSLICDNVANLCRFYGTYEIDNGIGLFRPQGAGVNLGDNSHAWNNVFAAAFSGVTNIWYSASAPSIAAAGCGGAAASIVTSNGTAAFKVNVGTTPTSACTITMPAAATGWNVTCNDITTQSTAVFVQKQTGAESTTSVTITNFNDVAVATAFTASDILKCSAFAD